MAASDFLSQFYALTWRNNHGKSVKSLDLENSEISKKGREKFSRPFLSFAFPLETRVIIRRGRFEFARAGIDHFIGRHDAEAFAPRARISSSVFHFAFSQ